jgi:hypothetical protein
VDGIKLTRCFAIATSQATISAGCLASTAGMHGCTGAQTRILSNLGTMLAGSVTSHYSHHRLAIRDAKSKQVGYLTHRLGSAYRTHQSVEATSIGTLNKCVGHTATTGKTTSTAIGTRQQFAHLRDAWILIDSKLLGGGKKHDSSYQSDSSKYNYCNQDKIHKYLYLF